MYLGLTTYYFGYLGPQTYLGGSLSMYGQPPGASRIRRYYVRSGRQYVR